MKLSFETDIEIVAWSTYHERPVVDGERVLCAGGGDVKDAVCVLASCDRRTGVVQAMTFVDDAYPGSEVSTSLPAALPENRAAICVYAKDQYLRLLVLDPRLHVERAIEIGADDPIDLRIHASDVSSKLWMGPLFVDDGGFLYSWVYRQVRFFRTERRRSDLTLAWDAPEWCHGVTSGVVVAETVPSTDRQLRGRDLESGRLRWEWPLSRIVARDAQGRDVDVATEHVAAVANGRVYLVDRTARAEDSDARLDRMLHELEQSNEQLEADFRAANPLLSSTTLSAVDVQTGEAWRASIQGDIVSIFAGPRRTLVVTAEEDGRGALILLDDNGVIHQQREHIGPVSAHWPPSPDRWASALAPDLLATRGALISLDGSLAESSRIALDVDAGFRCRTADRTLNEWRAAVDGNDVFLREGRKLIGVRV